MIHSNTYDPNAPKKATNLSINSDLLQQAKELHVNLSKIFEQSLAIVVREKRQKAWLEENREAIESYNRRIEQYGSFADRVREIENGTV
ncbi:hypothetical protein BH10PSE19_BH10PSE19_10330 [soil metagenome]